MKSQNIARIGYTFVYFTKMHNKLTRKSVLSRVGDLFLLQEVGVAITSLHMTATREK